jgi:hypothetical protein
MRHPGANRLYLRPHSRATTCETTCIWCLDPMSSHECINGHPPANVLASIHPQRGARRGAGAKGRWPNSAPARKRPTAHYPPQCGPARLLGRLPPRGERSVQSHSTASQVHNTDLAPMSLSNRRNAHRVFQTWPSDLAPRPKPSLTTQLGPCMSYPMT